MISQLRQFISDRYKSHLIFDFDKTIAQIDIDWSGWHKRVAEIYADYDPDHGFHPGKEHLFINDFIRRFGPEVGEQVNLFNLDYELRNTRGFIKNVELVELIKSLTSVNKYIFSSNSKVILDRAIKELGLTNLFNQIISRDEVTFIKPDPEGFSLIYDQSLPKNNYLMIGDSDFDQQAAVSFGIDFYLVDYFK